MLSLLLLLPLAMVVVVDGFTAAPVAVPTKTAGAAVRFGRPSLTQHSSTKPSCLRHQGTELSMMVSPVASLSSLAQSAISRPVTTLGWIRKAALILVSAWTMLNLKTRILWPGSGPDGRVDAPLPPVGSMGCPFFGVNFLAGNKDYGPYEFFDRMAAKMGKSAMYRFYMWGMPMVSVTGVEPIKQLIDQYEFREDGLNTHIPLENMKQIFGGESLLYEPRKAEHAKLRKLVGVAMSPKAIADATPSIQQAASDLIDETIADTTTDTVKMVDVCHKFTLDIAWKVILGLNLRGKDEIDEFHTAVQSWLTSIFNPLMSLPFRLPWLKRTKAWKYREYLVSKIETKLRELDATGPDASTLSNIYFSRDENGQALTHQQVIDNALILIVAGAETSSNTLTQAMLLFGLHPNVWAKVQQEQAALRAVHGEQLTKALIDNECPYLDAVVKETLRLRPIPSMELRQPGKTLVVDGVQLPKKYSVIMNLRTTHYDDAVTYQEDGSHMDVHKGFSPERWLDDDTQPEIWLPFGMGARRCIGERLAMTEMKVFIAMLARKLEGFDLTAASDKPIEWKKYSMMAQPADGVQVRLRPAQLAA